MGVASDPAWLGTVRQTSRSADTYAKRQVLCGNALSIARCVIY